MRDSRKQALNLTIDDLKTARAYFAAQGEDAHYQTMLDRFNFWHFTRQGGVK